MKILYDMPRIRRILGFRISMIAHLDRLWQKGTLNGNLENVFWLINDLQDLGESRQLMRQAWIGLPPATITPN